VHFSGPANPLQLNLNNQIQYIATIILKQKKSQPQKKNIINNYIGGDVQWLYHGVQDKVLMSEMWFCPT